MPPQSDTVELDAVHSDEEQQLPPRPYTDNDDEDDDVDPEALRLLNPAPDSPLLSPVSTQPAWLTESSSRRRRWLSKHWLSRLSHRLAITLRPRFTWRYILCSVIGLYTSYCVVTGSALFASRLPDYSGPHRVGAVDLEVPLEKPVLVSDTTLKRTGQPAFELETVHFTIYHPIDKHVHSRKPRHKWLPRPISLTAEGYATFAHANNFITRPIFTFFLWAIGGSAQIPAAVDVPLLDPLSSRKLTRSITSSTFHSGSSSADDEQTRWPVMVFSHGFASSHTDYTHYLGELASRGHVVAAIEHRDGSCPGTIVHYPSKPNRRVLPIREKDLLSDPPMDTPRLKAEQLAFRTAEIYETIRVLRDLDAGRAVNSTRSEGDHLGTFSRRLDFSQLTIGGHSYGATGALQALKTSNATAIGATAGIILDPGKNSGPLNDDISVPLLVVHSNSWSSAHSIFFGRPHFDTVRDLAAKVLERTGAAWFLTSKGTSHMSVTDAPLLEPLLLSWTTGATINVKDGLKEYVRISMDFFNYLEKGKATGLLTEKSTHKKYDEWVSDERKAEFPKKVAKYWQIHVSAEDKKK